MDTDQLIRSLAADNTHQPRPVGFVLALALLAAFPVSLLYSSPSSACGRT